MNKCCLEKKNWPCSCRILVLLYFIVEFIQQQCQLICLRLLYQMQRTYPEKPYIPANQNWTGVNDIDLLPPQEQSSQDASLKGVMLEDNSEDILKKTFLLKLQLLPQPQILFIAYYLFTQRDKGPVFLLQLGRAPKSS